MNNWIILHNFFLKCHAIEGEKTNIFWYRSYLVIVTKESPAWTKNSADMSKGREDKYILTIFDIQNKFIAYSAPVKPIQVRIRVMINYDIE